MNRYTSSFTFNEHTYYYCDLKKVFERYSILRKLPNSLKVLLETNIRNVQEQDITAAIATFVHKNHLKQIEFHPSRVIMQDFTGIPAMIDFASIRDFIKKQGGDETKINPKIMVDLVIDKSFDVNSIDANDCSTSVKIEKQENKQRYTFAKWAQSQFKNFSVIPPDSGICHQVNLEYLSTMLSSSMEDNKILLYPETIIGTDTHTTMINALGVFGYKVGGIEAQSTMLGESIHLSLPKVIGIEVVGTLSQGVSTNDAVFTLSNILKEHKVKDKIVEFYGNGLKNITVEDRATLSNITSEYKAICGYFGVDDNTISYVEQTRGVDASLIKEYFIKQGMYDNHDLIYDEYLKFDLSAIKPLVASAKKLDEKICVKEIPSKLTTFRKGNFVKDNDIVLAAITSCTSISNPTLLIQAGLLAKRACELGLEINKNIRRSFNPTSLVVKEYLERLDLLKYLEKLGFNIVSIGCNSCSVNSKDLIERVILDIDKFNLDVVSITSGNRTKDGAIHPKIKSNWQMSPALLIAYCLKGNMNFDITKEPIYQDIYLSDIWPSINQVNEYLSKIDYSMYQNVYKDIFLGNEDWKNLEFENNTTYKWEDNATYIQPSNFFELINIEKIEIKEAKILALLGNDVTTEYLSPFGQILPYTPSALYLESKGLHPDEFKTFASRRGNAEVMYRGALSNIRLKNKIVNPKEGGFTKDFSTGEILPIYDFTQKMKEQNIPLVIFAGDNFGIGESRDWAVKVMKLLGVKAIIAKSFNISYKENLMSMGILPLEFIDDDIENLHLKGNEIITIKTEDIKTNAKIEIEIKKENDIKTIVVQSKLETKTEINYYKNGGMFSCLLK
uniref:aconitate hydratase AcnA n=1 Tax=Aliarcobacter sp. TaxID=2321116 RepID=UPI004047826D